MERPKLQGTWLYSIGERQRLMADVKNDLKESHREIDESWLDNIGAHNLYSTPARFPRRFNDPCVGESVDTRLGRESVDGIDGPFRPFLCYVFLTHHGNSLIIIIYFNRAPPPQILQ